MTQRPWSWCVGPLLLAIAAEAHGENTFDRVQGAAPNAGGLRLDARGSPCDDARLNATLYDW